MFKAIPWKKGEERLYTLVCERFPLEHKGFGLKSLYLMFASEAQFEQHLGPVGRLGDKISGCIDRLLDSENPSGREVRDGPFAYDPSEGRIRTTGNPFLEYVRGYEGNPVVTADFLIERP